MIQFEQVNGVSRRFIIIVAWLDRPLPGEPETSFTVVSTGADESPLIPPPPSEAHRSRMRRRRHRRENTREDFDTPHLRALHRLPVA